MNNEKLFTMALNLSHPWYVKETKLYKPEKDKRGRLEITIDFETGAKFKDTKGIECSVHDTSERTWQHLNFFEHECYIKARLPRILNSENKVTTVEISWARPGSGFTLLFEAYIMLLIENEMPINKVARTMRLVANRLWRIFNYWIKDAVSEDKLENVKNIGIDETSSKKGHKYVTITADLDSKRVIHVTAGKDSDCIQKMSEDLEKKGGQKSNIENVSIDMSPSFISGVLENLPNANIIFDKFHVVQHLNKAIDEIRKNEIKSLELLKKYSKEFNNQNKSNTTNLKGYKFTLLTNPEKLNTRKYSELTYLLEAYPILGEAYRLRHLFDEFWQIEEQEKALSFLHFWCDIVLEKNIPPLNKFVNFLKAHWNGIINYTKNKINNGLLESINSKIQLAKKRARGYRNIDNFINMIYFLTGKLKFNYPHYPL